jgi:hypothetical protein
MRVSLPCSTIAVDPDGAAPAVELATLTLAVIK